MCKIVCLLFFNFDDTFWPLGAPLESSGESEVGTAELGEVYANDVIVDAPVPFRGGARQPSVHSHVSPSKD